MRKKTNRPKSLGRGYIGLGLGVIAITLIGIALSGALDVEPLSGRGSSITTFGLPVGIVITIIGVILVIRERRRRPH